jgi:hypothetical protein
MSRTNIELQEPIASDSQRVLLIGGILLAVSGMLLGDVFAMFVLHPNNGRIGEAMFAASQLIPLGDAEGILGHFMAIGGFLENKGTKIDAHSHIIHMGYIALLLAMLQPWVALSASVKRRAAWCFVLSAFLLSPSIFAIHYVGLAYSPLPHIGWASILADLFGAFLALVVAIQLWGMWRYLQGSEPSEREEQPSYISTGNSASRTLLVAGLLLIVSGFFYGMGLAAVNAQGGSPSEVDILKDIIVQAAARDELALGAAFGDYGNYQMYRAINIATHAHINEMGILLLLMSFVQGFVQYADPLRQRWALCAAVSGIALPAGIILEIPFGFIGSIIADLAGFTMVVALLAMLFGLLRYTGASDASTGGDA